MTLPLQPPMQSRLAAQAGSAARAERSIATAFFTSASAIEKRVTRAKAYLKRSHSLFDLDNSRQVGARLGSVHQTLYLLFNEGYQFVACRRSGS
jgi:predicted RNA polymerase sigma factor